MVPRARILCIPSFRLSCKGEKLQCSEDTRGFCSRHEHWTRDYRRDEISHAMMPHEHHLCLISSAVWRIFGTEPCLELLSLECSWVLMTNLWVSLWNGIIVFLWLIFSIFFDSQSRKRNSDTARLSQNWNNYLLNTYFVYLFLSRIFQRHPVFAVWFTATAYDWQNHEYLRHVRH